MEPSLLKEGKTAADIAKKVAETAEVFFKDQKDYIE